MEISGSVDHSLIDALIGNSSIGSVVSLERVKQIRSRSSVADGNSIYEIGDLFIVLVAPHAFPDVAADEARIIKQTKGHLPGSLSHVMLDVVTEGHLSDGRSFVVLPRGTPLKTDRLHALIERRSVNPIIFDWLRGLASLARPPSAETRRQHEASLRTLSNFKGLPERIRSNAEACRSRIEKDFFAPRAVPMHGDLWRGNLIRGPDGSVKVIDWRGFRMAGYGIFDLVKFASTSGTHSSTFRSEVARHSELLGIEMIDAWGTLLAACGHVAHNIDQMPRDRFISMTTNLYNYYIKTMGLERWV